MRHLSNSLAAIRRLSSISRQRSKLDTTRFFLKVRLTDQFSLSNNSSNLNLNSLTSPEPGSADMVLNLRSSRYRNRILISHLSSQYRRTTSPTSKSQIQYRQMCKHLLNNSNPSKPHQTLSASPSCPRVAQSRLYRQHVNQPIHLPEM